MAITSLCARLVNGADFSCDAPTRKAFQQVVLINKTDIADYTISLPDPETGDCEYKVSFELEAGTTGYRIQGTEAGSSFYGAFDKSRSDFGYPQYSHTVGILVAGISEATKCILNALDKSLLVAAVQWLDGTVEIYGIVNGLTTGDYTFNLQEGGGGAQIILQSLEDAPESNLPLIYESAVPGQENEDFDDAFAVAS